jgi:hypothetical protein
LDHQSSLAQLNGVKLILSKIKEITNGDFPVLLTGDFNVLETSDVVKHVTSNTSDVKMEDTCRISKHKHHGTSGTFAGMCWEAVGMILKRNRIWRFGKWGTY